MTQKTSRRRIEALHSIHWWVCFLCHAFKFAGDGGGFQVVDDRAFRIAAGEWQELGVGWRLVRGWRRHCLHSLTEMRERAGALYAFAERVARESGVGRPLHCKSCASKRCWATAALHVAGTPDTNDGAPVLFKG